MLPRGRPGEVQEGSEGSPWALSFTAEFSDSHGVAPLGALWAPFWRSSGVPEAIRL